MNENPNRDPLLLDHEIDGIRELDNKLPRWWVWLFNLSIGFAGLYMLYYHVFNFGTLSATEYQQEMKVGDALKNVALAKFEAQLPTIEPSANPQIIEQGRLLFVNLCAPCHRPDGGGQVGPNLTDDYWIHGPGFKDNVLTIYNGVPAKGMVT